MNAPRNLPQLQDLPVGCSASTDCRNKRPILGAHRAPYALTEHDQVAQLVDARRSERRAARHGSSTLPLVTDILQARQVPNWLP